MTTDPYPTDEELRQIEEWGADLDSLVNHVCNLWYLTEPTITSNDDGDRILTLVTGGWSGNEDVISRLRDCWFWTFYWEAEWAGGKYEFNLGRHARTDDLPLGLSVWGQARHRRDADRIALEATVADQRDQIERLTAQVGRLQNAVRTVAAAAQDGLLRKHAVAGCIVSHITTTDLLPPAPAPDAPGGGEQGTR